MVLKKMGLEEEMEKKRWGFFFFFLGIELLMT